MSHEARHSGISFSTEHIVSPLGNRALLARLPEGSQSHFIFAQEGHEDRTDQSSDIIVAWSSKTELSEVLTRAVSILGEVTENDMGQVVYGEDRHIMPARQVIEAVQANPVGLDLAQIDLSEVSLFLAGRRFTQTGLCPEADSSIEVVCGFRTKDSNFFLSLMEATGDSKVREAASPVIDDFCRSFLSDYVL